jgi:Membrane bound beta barrel domain (DUF5777)
MVKSSFLILLILLSGGIFQLQAQQEDSLKQIDISNPRTEYAGYAFQSSKVIMSQSLEIIQPGSMDLRILHRFGPFNGGTQEFFGLDNASMRLGVDLGLFRNLMVGVGRSTYKKKLDGYVKYRLVQQAPGKGGSLFQFW